MVNMALLSTRLTVAQSTVSVKPRRRLVVLQLTRTLHFPLRRTLHPWLTWSLGPFRPGLLMSSTMISTRSAAPQAKRHLPKATPGPTGARQRSTIPNHGTTSMDPEHIHAYMIHTYIHTYIHVMCMHTCTVQICTCIFCLYNTNSLCPLCRTRAEGRRTPEKRP